MDLPIYYNLSEFIESYLVDFPKWNASNYVEYLEFLHDEYEKLALAVDNMEEFIFEYFPYDDIYLNIEIDQNLMNVFLIQNPEIDGNISIGQQFLQLMDIDKNFVYQFLGMNFYKILQFVDNERIKISLTTNETDSPELDFSNNTDKVKLIMLEKLGVIDYIKSIQTKPDTISHTSEILSTFTGIPPKTLNTYLSPMIRPHRDDDEKNSPYKNPENREIAERELIKLKIKNIDANR